MLTEKLTEKAIVLKKLMLMLLILYVLMFLPAQEIPCFIYEFVTPKVYDSCSFLTCVFEINLRSPWMSSCRFLSRVPEKFSLLVKSRHVRSKASQVSRSVQEVRGEQFLTRDFLWKEKLFMPRESETKMEKWSSCRWRSDAVMATNSRWQWTLLRLKVYTRHLICSQFDT